MVEISKLTVDLVDLFLVFVYIFWIYLLVILRMHALF